MQFPLKICGEHFEPKMFLNDLRNRLQPHALPMRHNESDNINQNMQICEGIFACIFKFIFEEFFEKISFYTFLNNFLEIATTNNDNAMINSFSHITESPISYNSSTENFSDQESMNASSTSNNETDDISQSIQISKSIFACIQFLNLLFCNFVGLF